ncbi:fimbrial protein [Burkholderiaceae bacterium 26]|uniref:fimbrial protein n=1 Tax=unclassified Ralstonia TaxID=209769 RepID=UPI00061E99D9|nr:fimbrial protein [Ralstonia sp.]KJJ94770.1 fimbrial protein [Burkholderiaceae bacterium 26]HWV03872.1 fimbrial protein [Ralstonia sp.]
MIVKEFIKCAVPMIGSTVFAVLCLIAAQGASAREFYPFPATLSLPSGLPKGTVVARRFYTPTQLCGEAKCRLMTFAPFPYGADGPTSPLELKGLSMQVIVNGKAQKRMDLSDPYVAFSTPVELQLIRDSSSDIASSTTQDQIRFWFFTYTMTGATRIENYFSINKGSLTKIEGTCSVPSQTVELPPTIGRKLGGVGSTAGVRDFQIKINNCPKGYNRVGYTLQPMGGVADAPGVLPLGTDSTAKGVKIRLANRNGTAAKFGTSLKLDDYDKATGGSYMIPMQVSYIQTEATVTPGTVKGAISLRLDYL